MLTMQEVLSGRNSSNLRIKTSFLAGGSEPEPAWKLALILKLLLFRLVNTSCLMLTRVRQRDGGGGGVAQGALGTHRSVAKVSKTFLGRRVGGDDGAGPHL